MAFVPIYLGILALTIVIDYFAGILLEQHEGRKKKWILALSIVANVGVLAVFKYYQFIFNNISWLAHALDIPVQMPVLSILLPIGLSFHTFQAMSYTIEVYRGHQKAERNFGIYCLYVMFYPQLVAGPIERPQNLLHQFREEHSWDVERFRKGFSQMLWGFFKKVVIADRLSIFVNEVYGDWTHMSGANLWIAIVFFSFQIYCDFSGYSDMAIGLARMMGFRFPENFDSPYSSRSITEFWRRWHITLGAFMRDFLYIPLGGNRVGSKWRLYFNLWLVFLVSGLWHGASWNFVLWGAFHGFFLILDRLFLLKFLEKAGKVPATLFTFFIVAMAWVLFRIESWQNAKIFYFQLIDIDDIKFIELNNSFYLVLLLAILFSVLGRSGVFQRVSHFLTKENPSLSISKSAILTLITIVLFFLSVVFLSASNLNPFIYYRF